MMKPGVNLIGYAKSEQGLGEGCRLTANALSQTNVNWGVIDWEVNNTCRKEDDTLSDKISNRIEYDVSIINLNADQLLTYKKRLPLKVWSTYRIGIWYWELEELPDKWDVAFDLVDEIWAPTRFIQECLLKKAKCPVLYMPPGLKREEPSPKYDRAYFGLPENAFLFLNMFDFFSYSSRKNPKAAIYAFQKAFAPDDMSVGLVLKVNNLYPKDKRCKEIKKLIGRYKNIYLIPQIMTREEVNGLLNTCDVAVSLHRSEGLGLLCQEAMYYGKPVIATGWSGNMDFMNKDNSCLVGYKKIPVDFYYGLENGSELEWADANIDEAAEYMKKLFSDAEYRNIIAAAGKNTIRDDFSTIVCGKRMEERLRCIESEKIDTDMTQMIMSSFAEDYEAINKTANINYWMPIVCYGKLQFLKRAFKKFVRKFCSPVLIPIIEQQNEFNLSVSRLLFKHKRELELLKEENQRLKAKLIEYEEKNE